MPRAAFATVDDGKIRNYLLNPANPAKFGQSTRFGFQNDQWFHLADALKQHPIDNRVALSVQSPHGIKFVVECRMRTPDGRNPCLRSVWIVDQGQRDPRFVTAY